MGAFQMPETTLYEWAGGLPTLVRMTTIFYERHVPADDLVGPLFAHMAGDHPQRVAEWIGEVFGGPKAYSGQYGGYSRMLSEHIGKRLTEAQRARWVQLLSRSADEAGLPADPEFRAAFVAYLEWGSRLALENSQSDAHPPANMPMPRWWWVCDATPWSRQSALAPVEKPADVVSVAEGETVGFAKHIKPLFRTKDRQSMLSNFDLWSYDDVVRHSAAILHQVGQGSMPCDGPWPSENVETFRRWTTTGMSA
jgi:truncated hemoglobin YjbI